MVYGKSLNPCECRMRGLSCIALAVVAALLFVPSLSAQDAPGIGAGATGGDPYTVKVTKGGWSGEASVTVDADQSFQGTDRILVQVSGGGSEPDGGGSAPGTGTVPVGIVCLSSPIRFREYIPLPSLVIKSMPPEGVVGQTTYFWTRSDTFDGTRFNERVAGEYTERRPIYNEADEVIACEERVVPITVTVTYWPTGYIWRFGDDTTFTPEDCTKTRRPADCKTGLGGEERDGIPHVYEVSSLKHGEKGYRVELTVNFAVGLSFGGRFMMFPSSITQTQVHDLNVNQIQSVLIE
jgi:hypothetical protein